MKLRATVLLFAAFCFLVTVPAWGAASICDSVAGNVVTNCGFETGDLTGWAFTGSFSTVTLNAPYVNSGTYGFQTGTVGGDGLLTQHFLGNTLTFAMRQDPAYWGLDDISFVDLGTSTCHAFPGCNTYSAAFFLYNDGGTPNDFTVFWNGVNVGPSLVDAGGFPYTEYVATLEGYSTPEPGTMLLFGSGVLGLAGVIRRKLSL